VLIEYPPATKTRKPLRWLWIAGAGLIGVMVVAAVIVATHWPFTRAAIVAALEKASGRRVEIRAFSTSYFPPGCTAEDIHFLRHRHPEAQPIITVKKLVIRGSLIGFLQSPQRLSAVKVVGMHLIIPPPKAADSSRVLLNSGPGTSLAISKIIADGALLEFMPNDDKDKPYLLKVEKLAVTDVGAGTRMSYRVTLNNSEPPGVIRAEGKFGPWNPDDIGSTPVSGAFTYDDIDLGVFGGITGTAQARGQFTGLLARIETHGSVDVARFHVNGSDHSVPLATTFEATVNGTNGDVLLNPATARYRHTRIEVRGSIAGHEGDKGKTATFDIAVPQGRVDDLLYLFTKGDPGMSGDIAATGKFTWPPGPRRFLEKIAMDLGFGMRDSGFTNPQTQGTVNRLSESAEGESQKQLNSDSSTVLSALHGNIQMRGGTAQISNGSFQVPGADAAVHGTYNLLNQQVDIHGTLHTRGQLSEMTSGFKAVLVKALTPVFRKENSDRIVPFQITGAYRNAAVEIDWKKTLSPPK
jgi:hypothetical protein